MAAKRIIKSWLLLFCALLAVSCHPVVAAASEPTKRALRGQMRTPGPAPPSSTVPVGEESVRQLHQADFVDSISGEILEGPIDAPPVGEEPDETNNSSNNNMKRGFGPTSQLNGGQVAGVVVGVLLALAVTAAAVVGYWYWKRTDSRTPDKTMTVPPSEDPGDGIVENKADDVNENGGPIGKTSPTRSIEQPFHHDDRPPPVAPFLPNDEPSTDDPTPPPLDIVEDDGNVTVASDITAMTQRRIIEVVQTVHQPDGSKWVTKTTTYKPKNKHGVILEEDEEYR